MSVAWIDIITIMTLLLLLQRCTCWSEVYLNLLNCHHFLGLGWRILFNNWIFMVGYWIWKIWLFSWHVAFCSNLANDTRSCFLLPSVVVRWVHDVGSYMSVFQVLVIEYFSTTPCWSWGSLICWGALQFWRSFVVSLSAS